MSSLTSGCSDPAPAGEAAFDGDWALVQSIAKGDELALDVLLSRYEQDVRRTIGRLTAWGPDVEDLVQDVFIQAWRRAAGYEGHGSLRGWLLQIAINRCRNHHRATKRIWRTLMRFALHSAATRTASQLVDDHRWALIQAALTRLSYSDRELLVLVYVEQQDVPTLARQWAVSESSLHVRLHRARKRLVALIEKERVNV